MVADFSHLFYAERNGFKTWEKKKNLLRKLCTSMCRCAHTHVHTHTQQWNATLVQSLSCDPRNYSPPDSSVHGTSQARILGWVAMTLSRGSSWPRDRTLVSCIDSWIIDHWVTNGEAHFGWYSSLSPCFLCFLLLPFFFKFESTEGIVWIYPII